MDIAYLKDMYAEEWERRERIQSATGIPIALLTIVGGALVVFFERSMPFAGWIDAPFWSLFVATSVLLGIALYMLVRSYLGYMDRRLPLASQLQQHHETLTAHFAKSPTAAADVQREFDRFLAERYVDALDRNGTNNINRSAYLHKANKFAVMAFVATVLTAIPLGVQTKGWLVPRPVTPNRSQTVSTDDNSQQSRPAEQKPAETTPAKVPTGPANIDIRTGTRVPETKKEGEQR